MKKRIIGTVCVMAGLAAVAQSEVLAVWDASGYVASPVPANAPAAWATNALTGTPTVYRGPGLSAQGGTASFVAGGFGSGSLDGAVASNDYFYVSVTAAAGWNVTVTQMLARMRMNANGQTPSNLVLRSGSDSYSSDLAAWNITGSAINYTINFSPITVLDGQTLTFRLYAYGGNPPDTSDGCRPIVDGGNLGGYTGADMALMGSVVSGTPPPSEATTFMMQ